jgi:hypothetical protein
VIVSIHQPQYIPWLGYFYKIARSDVFVLFDTVQYPRGKHFGNRNLIKTAQGKLWLTVPVLHRSALRSYHDIEIDGNQRWAEKHWKSIELAYVKASAFDFFGPPLRESYIGLDWKALTDFEEALLRCCFDALQIRTPIVRSSSLSISDSALDGASHIFAILNALGADAYISGRGAGSRRYVDPSQFAALGIRLWYYDFTFPHYEQQWGDFIPELSVIDTLFNCGRGASELLAKGGRLLEL